MPAARIESNTLDKVATLVRFPASAERVWNRLLSYEEVAARPPLLLRLLLPYPLRTEGDKTRAGADVLCTYRSGHLVKRILLVEPPHLLTFQVVDQQLGIEDRLAAVEGSYEIRSCGEYSEVTLTTVYCGHLRPRFFWRPLERFLGHQFHRHILNGMRALLPVADSSTCTTSPSPSHR